MALFGAPLAHEGHAARACYAALAMQDTLRRYAEEVRRTHGLPVQMRVGLNSGEVMVRAIGNDLHMDYSAIDLYRTMDMPFWLTRAEAVLAQTVGVETPAAG